MPLESIHRALTLEIAEVKRNRKTELIEPAGIEPLGRHDLGFAYRIILASPPSFNPDQPLTFTVARTRDTIKATIVSQDDEGIVVHCEAPLPEDARLVKLGFDPTFILRALDDFLKHRLPDPPTLTESLLEQKIPSLTAKDEPWVEATRQHQALNTAQRRAVAMLAATPIQLLWGPPGTGKTHTLAHAVAQAISFGWSVLVVAPTNAALDALVASTGRLLSNPSALYRSGATTNTEAARHARSAHLRNEHPELVGDLEQSLDLLRASEASLIENYNTATANQVIALRKRVRELDEQVRKAEKGLLTNAPCVAVTSASLVLKRELRDRVFDLVVVDESSMVNIPYALAASCFARVHLCYGGDPKQLPPICQSDKPDATRWLARNLYHWLDMDSATPGTYKQIPFLDTQYRMTSAIGDLVSASSYAGKLKAARAGEGAGTPVTFIDTTALSAATHFSITEKSYFQPISVALLHALLDRHLRPPFLVLSPFRPQRSLLAEACRDRGLGEGLASTIHRAQGSESKTVVVDLTAYAADPVPRFYRSDECDKLINVAISRARDRLIIIGSRAMLDVLARAYSFWRAFVAELDRRVEVVEASSLVRATVDDADVRAGRLPLDPNHTVFYSHGASLQPVAPYARMLAALSAPRKVLCARVQLDGGGDVIYRRDEAGLPRMLLTAGRIYLPCGAGWLEVNAPSAATVLGEMAFGHLLADAVTAEDTLRLICPRCGSPTAVRTAVDGAKVGCTNDSPKCFYSRRLTRDEADKRGQMMNLRCSAAGCGAPMTAQTSREGKLFFSCINYPRCTATSPIRVLEGL